MTNFEKIIKTLEEHEAGIVVKGGIINQIMEVLFENTITPYSRELNTKRELILPYTHFEWYNCKEADLFQLWIEPPFYIEWNLTEGNEKEWYEGTHINLKKIKA